MKDNLSPVWEEDEVDLVALCEGDLDMRLRLVVFDDEDKKKSVIVKRSLSGSSKPKDQNFKVMGYCEASVKKLLEAKESHLPFTVLNKGEEMGQINVLQAELVEFKKAKEATEKLIAVVVAKVEAEEAEKTLEKALAEVEVAKKALEEKEAAIEVARGYAIAARHAYSYMEGVMSAWPSALRLDA